MNIATCFNKILLEIERKLKGIYDQERNCQVCGR
nr:MAG TPA: Rad50 zinc hook motif [Caudoviricetes sp.]